MAESQRVAGISPAHWADHFTEFDQAAERHVSDRTLIGTVAFLIGVNLWFVLVILFLGVEWLTARA